MSAFFKRIMVVGVGKMGSALVEGWLAQGVDPASLHLVDPALADTGDQWAAKGVHCHISAADLPPGDIDLLMLAIKPQMMGAVLPSLAALDHKGLVVLSIAAGTPMAALQQAFGKAVCVRSMPNTPASVGAGVTAAYGPALDEAARAGLHDLLQAVGAVVWVDSEGAMDAVTAISGSGPAYVFHMVEALEAAARKLGLSQETAQVLARQTIVGAGALLQASEEGADTLRENVTSPGGTTAAGLSVLQQSGALEELMLRTAQAAFDRSVALASGDQAPKEGASSSA